MQITNDKNQRIFALDIGTRSVIGIVGYSENGLFYVEAVEAKEHPQRAMMDGQIEDIAAVAKIASEVKAALESKIGSPLTNVCVAAAGRALRTSRAAFQLELVGEGAVTTEIVSQLELGAISAAGEAIGASETGSDLLCVGHSVVKFSVDGYTYSSIIDHKGKLAQVEIIATFLPAPVITSLEATMQKIGLTIDFLTLEPIAAMNAVIPKELRLLNLALVDIGAGTSDIAICADGSVAAYTMATIAGDEITEALIRHFLIDFDTAEKIKHEAASGTAVIKYCDIMGFEYEQSLEQIVKAIGPSLSQLADTICEKTVEINGRAPAAVFLVGGGSHTPLLCQLVAKKLGLDERKVALGVQSLAKRVIAEQGVVFGPEFATPLGIALTAAEGDANRGFEITLNGERRRLLRTGTLTLMDVLLLCGYSYADIMGKRGKNVIYQLDGRQRTGRGGMLKPASLLLNKEPTSISAKVVSGDVLHVAPAVQGSDALVRVRDVLPENECFNVTFNGNTVTAGQRVQISGVSLEYDYIIKDGDVLDAIKINTLAQLLASENVDAHGNTFLINGSVASLNSELIAGDVITQVSDSIQADMVPVLNDIPANTPSVEPIATPENEPIASPENAATVSNSVIKEDTAVTPIDVVFLELTINNQRINLPPKADGTKYLFLDMLTLVEIDPSKPQGDIALLLNGVAASFLDEISSGDSIEIYWKKR